MKNKNEQGAANEHVAEGKRVLLRHSGSNALARDYRAVRDQVVNLVAHRVRGQPALFVFIAPAPGIFAAELLYSLDISAHHHLVEFLLFLLGWVRKAVLDEILEQHVDYRAHNYICNAATDYDSTLARYTNHWTQIADRFQDYDEHLIFESMNEVGFDSLSVPKAYKTLNRLNQAFVDLIRSSGGKNPTRHLLIAGYWTDIQKTCNNLYQMPEDPAGRCIVSVHYYTPWDFCTTNIKNEWGTESEQMEMESLIGMMKTNFTNKGIVIYADKCYPGDEILDKLVHNGITNIIANYPDVDEKTNISMMAQDLKECITEGLSQKKWRRFDKSFDAFAEAREAARIAEKEKPRYSQSNISIAVVGAQGRIGATTFAMQLAAYFKSRDRESLVVCANKRGFPQLEMMSEYYGGTEQSGIYTINVIDICTALTEPEKQYNVQIYDYGSLPTSELRLDSFDKVFLIGGTSWNELPMIYMAQQPLNSVNYTVAVNFSDKAAVEKNKEFLMLNLNEVMVLPFEPDPFAIEQYEDMFDEKFSMC